MFRQNKRSALYGNMSGHIGFTLIEILIGMAIASLVSIIIMRVFLQTTRTTTRINALVDEYADFFIVNAQLARDISGIAMVRHKKNAPDAQQKSEESYAPQDTIKPNIVTDTLLKENGKAKESGEALFHGIVRSGKFESVAFVSTNGLPTLDQTGSSLVRIRYYVAPQPDNTELFRMMREEVPYKTQQKRDRTREKSEKPQSYQLLPDIIRMTMTFYTRQIKNKISSLVSVPQWGKEEHKGNGQLVPEFIGIEGTIRGRISQKEIPFSFLYPVPVSQLIKVESEDKKTHEKKK